MFHAAQYNIFAFIDSPQSEATTGFEPVIRVLQTLALPLGHVAILMAIRLDKDC